MIYRNGDFYSAICDCCSNVWEDKHEGWTSLADSGDLRDELKESDWLVENESDVVYCPDCYSIDEDDNVQLSC